MAISTLTPMHRYAAGALFAIALRQAEIHQTRPLGVSFPSDCGDESTSDDSRNSSSRSSSGSSGSRDDACEYLPWTHPSRSLLRPVLRFLEIDSKAWPGLEETALLSPTKHHIGAFLRLLSEEIDETPSESIELELSLSKSVDAMAMNLEVTPASSEVTREKQLEYERDRRERTSTTKVQVSQVVSLADAPSDNTRLTNSETSTSSQMVTDEPCHSFYEKMVLEEKSLSYQRKVAILFQLLSACLANMPDDDRKNSQVRKGYDARHRVALRLLATWLDVKSIKMEAMEIIVAFSAMTARKEQQSQREETDSYKGTWSRWKRGAIIGAAALTGGTLLAITGGLAAPAIAAGFGALAPTLGTLIPVIGARGFAAAAIAAASVAGSIAVAASFGAAGAGLFGTKMARRIGEVDGFEFIPIGENHNQGRLAVGILVSGFAFEEGDFIRPWEGCDDNLERTYIGVDEARCHGDCIKYSSNCIGLASCFTFSH